MANHIKNNITDLIKKINPKVKFNSASVRYLEMIIKNICTKYFKLHYSKIDNFKIIKQLYKQDMAQILIKLIINRENIYENNTNTLYKILLNNINKNIKVKLGKRKRFDDNFNNKKIKKMVLKDINNELSLRKINNAKNELNLLKNKFKFKIWLKNNYQEIDHKILSILSIIIEYTCLEIIDITIIKNKNRYLFDKDDVIKSINSDEELLYFINNIC